MSGRRVATELRSAPLTYGYLALLCGTTWALALVGPRLANRVLLDASTNLRHLAHDPVRVLVGSAFWLASPYELAAVATASLLVVARVERRLGWRRTVAVFLAGHVGATLLTAAGLWIALQADAVEHNVVNARDVGASYGVLAVAGVFTYGVRPGLRAWYWRGALGVLLVVVAVSPSFTNVGHVLAFVIGLACRRLAVDRSSTLPA